MEHGQRIWKTYETLYVDAEDFTQIGEAFEAACPVKKATLGNGVLTLMDFAVTWIEQKRSTL